MSNELNTMEENPAPSSNTTSGPQGSTPITPLGLSRYGENNPQLGEDFPPLPTLEAINGGRTSSQHEGRVRLVFGRGKPRDSENTKRPQPPSPMKDRTPKRHTSQADPPVCSPELPAQATGLDSESPDHIGSQTNSAGYNQEGYLRVTASHKGGNSEVGMEKDVTRDSMEIDEEYINQSSTAVADNEWDELLRNSPSTTRPRNSPFFFNNPPSINLAQPSPTSVYTGDKTARKSTLNTLESSPVSANRVGRRAANEFIHKDTKCEDHVVTNSAGLQRTATPNGGWPKIHLDVNPLDNVVPAQVAAWKKITTGKLWARVFRGRYENNSLSTVDKTRALIKGLIRIENDVALGVSFPQQERAMNSDRFPTPYHMFVSGLSAPQVDHLINLEIVSTKEITVIFKPFNDQRPSFVLTIYGLTFNDSSEANQAVTDLVKMCIRDSESVTKHVMDCAPNLKDRICNDILNNISVKFLHVRRSYANGGEFRGWNVFLHHSYLSDEDHIKLIQLMRTCTFPSATAGFGLPLRGNNTLLCVNCKSIDHDMLNCPFPDLPGWLGYKTPPEQQNQASARAYGDGAAGGRDDFYVFRGRGRGRGGRGGRPYGRRGFRGQWM